MVESLTAATHILFYIHKEALYYLYTWLNGSCQTISKIPLDSINQTHLILVVYTDHHFNTTTSTCFKSLSTNFNQMPFLLVCYLVSLSRCPYHLNLRSFIILLHSFTPHFSYRSSFLILLLCILLSSFESLWFSPWSDPVGSIAVPTFF